MIFLSNRFTGVKGYKKGDVIGYKVFKKMARLVRRAISHDYFNLVKSQLLWVTIFFALGFIKFALHMLLGQFHYTNYGLMPFSQ
ncbi:hypothetical protein SAMN05192573_102368 [Mucilaginibacter gossypii]|uniref:Uncharacterized protein n=1 Tax=Mucilaginibacter gossypii TaxID=551996 RepID=A0A1G7RUR8_9SPHI|nr:hypothetical protein SAMN05192573_102368 [Mucilaginibacter gossypii]